MARQSTSDLDSLISEEQSKRRILSQPSRWLSQAKVQRASREIETARRGGRAMTGEQMSRHHQAALKRLLANPSAYAKGGKVQRSGLAKVHKGETILTRAQSRRFHRS